MSVLTTTSDLTYPEVLWARPGVGAWRYSSLHDPDIGGALVTSRMKAMAGSPSAPPSFAQGDILLLFDPINLKYIESRLDDASLTPLPVLTIEDITVNAGGLGPHDAVFTARLSNPTNVLVHARWRTQDGTAVYGRDYVDSSGTIEFQPGQTWTTLTVPVFGDPMPDEDETFSVVVTAGDNAILLGSKGTCTLHDVAPKRRSSRH